jgi:hypothetical protein
MPRDQHYISGDLLVAREPPLQENEYVSGDFGREVLVGAWAYGTGYMDFFPIRTSRVLRVDGGMIDVKNYTGSPSLRFCLYSNSSRLGRIWGPRQRLASGVIAVSSTREQQCDFGEIVKMVPGIYWLGFSVNAGFSGRSSKTATAGTIMGRTGLAGGGTAYQSAYAWLDAVTYGNEPEIIDHDSGDLYTENQGHLSPAAFLRMA